MIYHIVPSTYWATFEDKPAYFSETFDAETFIHCSLQEQVAGVLERYYVGVTGLVLLHIDESKLTSTLLYEPAPHNGELFPHIYGGINREAVVEVTPLS